MGVSTAAGGRASRVAKHSWIRAVFRGASPVIITVRDLSLGVTPQVGTLLLYCGLTTGSSLIARRAVVTCYVCDVPLDVQAHHAW